MKKTKEKVKDITEEVSKNLNTMNKEKFYKMSNLTQKVHNLIKEPMKFRLLKKYLRESMRSSSMLISLT